MAQPGLPHAGASVLGGPAGPFVKSWLMSRPGPRVQPRILSGPDASSLGPPAMATFPPDPRGHSGERGQLGEGADLSHAEPALTWQYMNRGAAAHVLLPTTGPALPTGVSFVGEMKMTKRMALMTFSSGDFHKDWVGFEDADPRNLELGQWLKSSQSLGAPSSGSRLHRPQPKGSMCSRSRSTCLLPG